MKNRGFGRVFQPTRKCLRCKGEGCTKCGGSGRRKIDVWHVQYSHRSKQYRESSGSTKRSVALKLLRKRQAEMGAKKEFTGPAPERTTFEELCEILIVDYKNNQRKSIRRTRICIKRLSEFFAGDLAIDVTSDRIARYIERRFDDGVAPATVRNETNALKRAFTLAMQAGKVAVIPHFPTLRINNTRTGFFEESEIRSVIEHLPNGLGPIAEFGYLSGWRLTEILTLKWRNVDFEAGVIRLEVGTTKNDDGRVLPFHVLPALADLMRRQRERTDAKEPRHNRIIPWVFHRRGKQIKIMDKAWQKACKEAGCAGRLFHDLRRTAVRNLERAGVPRSVAMKITGHKTESVYRRYAIVNEKDIGEGLAKLGRFLERRSG